MSVHRFFFQGKENWNSGSGTVALHQKSKRPSAFLLSWQQEPLWLYFQKTEKKYLPPELPPAERQSGLGRLHHSCAHLRDAQPCTDPELPSLYCLHVCWQCSRYCQHRQPVLSVFFFFFKSLYHGASCLSSLFIS